MTTRIFCWLALLLLASGAAAQTRVISADELAHFGAARLADVFELLDDWASASVDGYGWDVSVAGLAPLERPAWMLFVDGTPVDLRVLGRQDVNVLAVSMTEIEAVEVYEKPAVIAGRFAPAGALHVRTRAVGERLAVSVAAAVGNETGDPGPFRHTPLASPNVDRIGPTFQGALSAAGRRWFVRAQGKADEHHATDERIRDRVLTLYRGVKAPRLILGAVRAKAGTASPRGRHAAFGSASRFQGLYFFDPMGLEVPADHRYLQAGVTGREHFGSSGAATYGFSVARSDFRVRPNPRDIRGFRDERRLSGHVGLSADRASAGISADIVDASFSGSAGALSHAVLRAYGTAARHLGSKADVSASVVVSQAGGEFSLAALSAFEARLARRADVALHASVSRRLPAEAGDLSWWVARGYEPPHSSGLSPPGESGAERTLTADGALTGRFSRSGRLVLGAGWREFTGLTLAGISPHYDSLTTGFRTPTVFGAPFSGRTARVSLAVEGRLHAQLHVRLHGALLRPSSPQEAFRRAWHTQPARRAGASVRFAAGERLRLHARFRYLGPRRYVAYDRAAEASGGRYESRLPAAFLLDVTATKHLWEHRLTATMALRNVLNHAYRAHPAGAVGHMALHLGIRMYFRRPLGAVP